MMDYLIHTDTISMEKSIMYFKGLSVKISIKNDLFMSLKIVFILANSEDTDEMSGISSGSSLFAKEPVYRYLK